MPNKTLSIFLENWNRFWFKPTLPLDLAINRILYAGIALYFFRNVRFPHFTEISPELWNPIWVFRIPGLSLASFEEISLIQNIWTISLVLMLLGFATRLACITAAISSLFLFGVLPSFGINYGNMQPIVLIQIIFAFTKCGDTLSVDSLLKKRFSKKPAPIEHEKNGEYFWPIRLGQFFFCAIFVSAGLSKLRGAGIEWATTDTLSNYLLANRLFFRDELTGTLGADIAILIAHSPNLCRLLAFGSLALELLTPLMLFSRGARWVILAQLVAFQISITLLLGPNFRYFSTIYIFWIPWESIVARFRPASIYDITKIEKTQNTPRLAS